MEVFTEAVLSVILGNVELLEELKAIMRQEHKPFLTKEQAFVANTNIMKQHMQEKFTRWINWLPTVPIDCVGAALAEEAFEFIEWERIAKQLQEGLCKSESANN